MTQRCPVPGWRSEQQSPPLPFPPLPSTNTRVRALALASALLQSTAKLKMYSLAYVTASSPLQGAGLYTDGQVGASTPAAADLSITASARRAPLSAARGAGVASSAAAGSALLPCMVHQVHGRRAGGAAPLPRHMAGAWCRGCS